MKQRLLNLALILTSLLGYLEWGQDQSVFLFQAELDILIKLFNDPGSILHPLTLLPLLGQLILLFTLFQSKPSKIPSFIGIGCLGSLFLFILIAGILGSNLKVILCTLPFLLIAVYSIWNLKNKKT